MVVSIAGDPEISVVVRHSVRFAMYKNLHTTDNCSLIGGCDVVIVTTVLVVVVGGIIIVGDSVGASLLIVVPPPPLPQFPAAQYPPTPATTPPKITIEIMHIVDNQQIVLFEFVSAVVINANAVKLSSIGRCSGAACAEDDREVLVGSHMTGYYNSPSVTSYTVNHTYWYN